VDHPVDPVQGPGATRVGLCDFYDSYKVGNPVDPCSSSLHCHLFYYNSLIPNYPHGSLTVSGLH